MNDKEPLVEDEHLPRKRIIAAGLVTGGGRTVFEGAMQEDRTVPSQESCSVPAELAAALESNPVAAENSENMTATHHLMYAARVSSAKKPETRQKRTERSIGSSWRTTGSWMSSGSGKRNDEVTGISWIDIIKKVTAVTPGLSGTPGP
ncbi:MULTISPECIES: YdeI family protein [unclassified Methanoregula]|uniref:YdeI/OmpD-associated family protein n=1 Tax=unclassified Methanoregula TaxID=2649730 RepID=UPI0025CE9E94|nr:MULTISPECIES: YdeI/OmpD-associated family protein [unclassified Methanoregula]